MLRRTNMMGVIWILGTALVMVAGTVLAQPYNPIVLWDRSGAGADSWYGVKIVPLGDQNDDGYADFAVWAGGSAPPGDPSEERLEFFHGAQPPEPDPYLTFRGSLFPGSEIRYFSGVGDVNGDGYKDWEICWEFAAVPGAFEFDVYWGGPDADANPDFVVHGSADQDLFPVGDFNGDGFDDLVIYLPPPEDVGRMLFGAAQPDTVPDWVRHSPQEFPYQAFPQSFGDLNGDGYSDFVSSTSPSVSTTYIFLGGADPDTIPAYVWEDVYGYPSIMVRDLNGDGYDDLALHGYPQWTVHLGGASLSPIPDFQMDFIDGCSWDQAATLGDVNHDGYQDMAVIDPGCNNLWGTLSVYLGHPWLNPDPVITIEGRELPLDLIGIRTAAGLGDVNGDGIDDFAIGAANTNFDGRRGRVVVLSGDTTLRVGADNPRPELPNDLSVSVYPNPFNSVTTIELQVPMSVQTIQLDVYNLLGQKVFEHSVSVRSGEVRYVYDASGLSTGLYFLRVHAGSLSETHKLMVLR